MIRSFISPTALLVNVIARMRLNSSSLELVSSILRYALVTAKVLPLPADADMTLNNDGFKRKI